MAGKQKVRPVGEVRHSQLITTYGPGAMVDLPDCSVVVGGLSAWVYDRERPPVVIDEPRLIAKLRYTLGLSHLRLQQPPLLETGPGGQLCSGIGSPDFPNWFVAQVEDSHTDAQGRIYRSRPLVERSRLDKGRYVDDNRKSHPVVPIRFVQSCPNGHLSDVDWRAFAHGGKTPCREVLRLDEAGAGNDFTEIYVRCPRCNKRRQLSATKQSPAESETGAPPVLGFCQGHRPWLGPHGQEPCQTEKGKAYPNRLLVRSASNAYFPELVTAISIPEPIDEVRQAINRHLRQFDKIHDLKKLTGLMENVLPEYGPEPLAEALAGQDPAAVFAALQSIRGGDEAPAARSEPLKVQELRALLGSVEQLSQAEGPHGFEAERLDLTAKPAWFTRRIDRVLKVHRLREVMALIGFTRLEPVVSQIDGDPLDLGVKRAALDIKEPTWLPAVENLGEGIFLGFSAAAIQDWLQQDGVKQHLSRHQEAFKIWNQEHGLTEEKFAWPGGAYLMLHSLAHLLITEMALDCGYGASAIKERIFAFADIGYGILLYTGGSGAEGTLGGLVALADRIDDILLQALERGGLCSNDPFCSSHQPNDALEKRYAHGAACHGCLLIAETSCERRNEFLDRALVVPTLEQRDAAFFPSDLVMDV